MRKAGRIFSYWGECQLGCSWPGPVCGINGVNYESECSAWSDYVLMDYRGRCREIGLLDGRGVQKQPRCRLVKCQTLPHSCRSVIPPGACCPICANAGIHIIISRKQIDRALYALRGQNKDLLTLHQMLKELDSFIQVAECQLTGYLTIEMELFIAIVPRKNLAQLNLLQIDACNRESERISALISTQSHRITTNLILSGLIQSYIFDEHIDNSAIKNNNNFNIYIVFILCIISYTFNLRL